ncbi:TolC family protein [Marinilabiliaceae bacterium JC017]|nr:TolC family protein [Marinilabiliaceae bacterium JC017]
MIQNSITNNIGVQDKRKPLCPHLLFPFFYLFPSISTYFSSSANRNSSRSRYRKSSFHLFPPISTYSNLFPFFYLFPSISTYFFSSVNRNSLRSRYSKYSFHLFPPVSYYFNLFPFFYLFPSISTYFSTSANRNSCRLYCFYAFLSISIFCISPATGQNELNGYLQTAAENNPGLKAKFNTYMAALEVAPQVKALPDPQVSFGYFIQPVETRVGPQEFKLSASQMFPWFGTLKAKENIAIQTAKAKYEAFEEAKSKLFNEVRSTYYNLYFIQKAIGITTENIGILNTFRQLVYVKVEAGGASLVDEYRIEMEIGDLENQLALLRDKQFVWEVMFNNLLNTKEQKPVIVPHELGTPDFSLSKQAALDSMRLNNHQLLSVDRQVDALRYRRDVAGKNGKPNFTIGMDYTFVGKGDGNMAGTDAFMFPKVGITIPLYRNKYKAMVQEVVYLEAAKENEKMDKANVLETIFEEGWKDYRDGDRRIALYEVQLDLAQKSLKLLETDYATGKTGFEEILRMERKLLKYYLELEKAKADKQAAISFITYLMGK